MNMRQTKQHFYYILCGIVIFLFLLVCGATQYVYASESEQRNDTEVGATDKSGWVQIDSVNFPQLYKVLSTFCYDKNQDGWLNQDEIRELKELAIPYSIDDLSGIDFLYCLENLCITDYTGDILTIGKKNKSIKGLFIKPSKETITIDAPYVESIGLGCVTYNEYVSYDRVEVKSSYEFNAVINNATKKIVLTRCVKLKRLDVKMGNVTELVMPKKGNALEYFCLRFADLEKIDLSNCAKLAVAEIECCDYLKKLDFTGNANLMALRIDQLPALGNINLSKCKMLKYLDIGTDIGLKKLDLSNCNSIIRVFVHYWTDKAMTTVMPSGKKALLSVGNGYWENTEAKNDYKSYWKMIQDYHFYGSCFVYFGFDYDLYDEQKKVKLNKKNFPDLYYCLKEKVDQNGDGWLSQAEMDSVTALVVTDSISSLKGIEYFENLTTLVLNDFSGKKLVLGDEASNIERLKVRSTAKELTVVGDDLQILDITFDSAITTKIDVSGCSGLKTFSADGMLDTLDEGGKPIFKTFVLPMCGNSLKVLILHNLNIVKCDISAYTNLECLDIFRCVNLTELSVKNNTKLRVLSLAWCSKLKAVDVSKNEELEELCAWSPVPQITYAKGKKMINRSDLRYLSAVGHCIQEYRELDEFLWAE